jgi:hypothetical protein
MLGNAKKVERAFRARGVCDTAVRIAKGAAIRRGRDSGNFLPSISQSSVLLPVLMRQLFAIVQPTFCVSFEAIERT